jgi:hypothetical protein
VALHALDEAIELLRARAARVREERLTEGADHGALARSEGESHRRLEPRQSAPETRVGSAGGEE